MCCLWVAVDLPLDYFILRLRILEDGREGQGRARDAKKGEKKKKLIMNNEIYVYVMF